MLPMLRSKGVHACKNLPSFSCLHQFSHLRNQLLLYNIIVQFLWFLWAHDGDQRPPHALFIMPRIHLCPLQEIQRQHMVIKKFQENRKGIKKSHIFR